MLETINVNNPHLIDINIDFTKFSTSEDLEAFLKTIPHKIPYTNLIINNINYHSSLYGCPRFNYGTYKGSASSFSYAELKINSIFYFEISNLYQNLNIEVEFYTGSYTEKTDRGIFIVYYIDKNNHYMYNWISSDLSGAQFNYNGSWTKLSKNTEYFNLMNYQKVLKTDFIFGVTAYAKWNSAALTFPIYYKRVRLFN